VPVAIALVIGTIAAEEIGGGMLAWCGLAAVAAAAWVALYFVRVSPRWLMLPLLVFVAAAGAARFHSAVDPPPDDVGRLAVGGRRLTTIEGIVVRSARQNSPPDDVFLPAAPYYIHSTLYVDCHYALVDDRWVEASGQVSVVVHKPLLAGAGDVRQSDGPTVPQADSGAVRQSPAKKAQSTDGRAAQQSPDGAVPQLGDRVQVMGILSPLGTPANPGAFDVAGYLQRQGVRAGLRVNRWESVRTVEPRASKIGWLLGVMQRLAVGQLDRLPSEEGRAVVASMLFGRRDLMDFDSGEINGQDIQRAFLATGTTQFLAVSGFNVALVVSPLLILLRLLRVGRRTTAVVVAVAVLAFVMMTELEPPVLRAAILFWVLCLAWLTGRDAPNLNTVAASVILIVLLRPGDLMTVSFQLSFLSVLGLIFVVDRVDSLVLAGHSSVVSLSPEIRRRYWYRKIVKGMLMVSVAAAVVTVPLVAAKFHLIAWQSPLANAIMTPLVYVLTVAGMVLVAVGWIAPWVASAASLPLDLLARAISWLVRTLAGVPGAYFYVADVSVFWIAAMYGLLVAWIWRVRLGIPRRRMAMAVLAAAAVFVWTGGHHPPQHVRATFLAVGNGNTNVIELPNGCTFLYDAGSALSYTKAAESVTAPALWSLGIDHVDAVFISHAHFDHFKDILPLVERFRIRQVFVPPTFIRQRLHCDKQVIEALLARGVSVECFGAGDRLGGTGGVEVAGLWPQGPKSMGRAINDGSLVLAVASEGRRLLLTGDLMAASMGGLMEAEPDLRVDAMLWPHHGHDPDSEGRFAVRTGAKVLVASGARSLLPQMPPPWAKENRIACYHTGDDGAVTLELRPEGVAATALCGAASMEPPDANSEGPVAGDD
jgi:competence protein ComEC